VSDKAGAMVQYMMIAGQELTDMGLSQRAGILEVDALGLSSGKADANNLPQPLNNPPPSPPPPPPLSSIQKIQRSLVLLLPPYLLFLLLFFHNKVHLIL
jgi:hypothetical protein